MRLVLASLAFLLMGTQDSDQRMRLTIYDDGLSCPGNCDAHVVANRADNGTRFVSLPASPRTAPRACVSGQPCRICFGQSDSSCMIVMYRGRGPGAGRIDATPAFYTRYCGQSGIPGALAAHCAAMDRAVQRSGYDRRTNCVLQPDNSRCTALIAGARAAVEADRPLRDRCRAMGEAAFNRSQTDPNRRRANDCLYSEARLGGGGRWRRLLPASCRPGSFVGRDGLDCCTGDVRFAVHAAPECTAFFPAP